MSLYSETPIEWAVSDAPVPYPDAMAAMDERVAGIIDGSAPELIWFLQHPPLYTAGTSARAEDLLDANRFPVFEAGRGGQFTYHGPGQRIAYVMLDLSRRQRDVRKFVQSLEQVVIDTLAAFNVKGERRDHPRIGVWVDRQVSGGPPHEDKISALGIRLKKWVSFHGLSLNVDPDLSHFGGITPCGVSDPQFGVTSLVDLGLPVSLADADIALKAAFEEHFGPLFQAQSPHQ
ncbi:MAG: lipoate-protein ligase B [Ponticaulis sp.]|nr:lipoate-protein ligase B [Ponticaulis sp.]